MGGHPAGRKELDSIERLSTAPGGNKHGIFSEQWFEVIFSSAAVSLKLTCKPKSLGSSGQPPIVFCLVQGKFLGEFFASSLLLSDRKRKKDRLKAL